MRRNWTLWTTSNGIWSLFITARTSLGNFLNFASIALLVEPKYFSSMSSRLGHPERSSPKKFIFWEKKTWGKCRILSKGRSAEEKAFRLKESNWKTFVGGIFRKIERDHASGQMHSSNQESYDSFLRCGWQGKIILTVTVEVESGNWTPERFPPLGENRGCYSIFGREKREDITENRLR